MAAIHETIQTFSTSLITICIAIISGSLTAYLLVIMPDLVKKSLESQQAALRYLVAQVEKGGDLTREQEERMKEITQQIAELCEIIKKGSVDLKDILEDINDKFDEASDILPDRIKVESPAPTHIQLRPHQSHIERPSAPIPYEINARFPLMDGCVTAVPPDFDETRAPRVGSSYSGDQFQMWKWGPDHEPLFIGRIGALYAVSRVKKETAMMMHMQNTS